MGRYDGEDYAPVPACAPSQHQWQMNGTCRICRNSRPKDTVLVEDLRPLLEVLRETRWWDEGDADSVLANAARAYNSALATALASLPEHVRNMR